MMVMTGGVLLWLAKNRPQHPRVFGRLSSQAGFACAEGQGGDGWPASVSTHYFAGFCGDTGTPCNTHRSTPPVAAPAPFPAAALQFGIPFTPGLTADGELPLVCLLVPVVGAAAVSMERRYAHNAYMHSAVIEEGVCVTASVWQQRDFHPAFPCHRGLLACRAAEEYHAGTVLVASLACLSSAAHL